MTDFPLLQRSWARAWAASVGSGAGHALRDQVLAAYAEPQRHYHTQQHLAEVLALCEATQTLAQDAAAVELAVWFHDAVYNPRASDNELRSAHWAQQALAAAGAAPALQRQVFDLVMATQHHAVPTQADAQWLVDMDLAILGAAWDRFAQYEHQVREEYAWVPDAVFWPRRQALLQGFLERPCIYQTEVFRVRFEEQARSNLARSAAAAPRRPGL